MLFETFSDVLRNRRIVVHSDSMSAVACVRTLLACLDSPAMAHLTRAVLGRCVELNVRVLPVHIPGSRDVLADPLSRDKFDVFARNMLVRLRSRGASSEYLRLCAAPGDVSDAEV